MMKILCLLLTLLLAVPALAEEPTIPYELLVPVRVLPEEDAAVPMEDAIAVVYKKHGNLPEQISTRATLTESADGRRVWVISIFNTATFVDSWCNLVDAEDGSHLFGEDGNAGQFSHINRAWTEQKGGHALWRMEDKAFYDALYALEPMYGLPQPGDMTAEEAGERAAVTLAPYYPAGEDAGYLVCYGYIMGGEGCNGIWEICMVDNGHVIYQVNMDAVTGEIYYLSAADNGNG